MAVDISQLGQSVSFGVRKVAKEATGFISLPNGHVRLAGGLMAITIVLYGWIMMSALNWASPAAWLLAFAVPFTDASILVAIVNSWSRKAPVYTLVPEGAEQMIAIMVSTCGEPVEMVCKTIESLLTDGGWPLEKIVLTVGDDKKNPDLKAALELVIANFPNLFAYHYLTRDGGTKNKAGNLNNQWQWLEEHYPGLIGYLTQDADDLVPQGAQAIRHLVSALMAHPQRGFVQAVKDVIVPEGDPFGAVESVFYAHQQLQYRMGSDTVVACGSGLVWSPAALRAVQGFASKGPVEDLETSYQMTRKGYPGLSIETLGALGQIAPIDIPNLLKQRLTWCLDTWRLLFGSAEDHILFAKGLTFRQRLQYLEVALYYIHALPSVIYLLLPVFALFFPVFMPGTSLWFIPAFAVAAESYLRIQAGRHYVSLWRSRLVAATLVFGYVMYAFRAFTYYRKPVAYKVTKKFQSVGWYWKEQSFQYVTFGVNLAALPFALRANMALYDKALLVAFIAYTLVYLSYALKLSWYGYDFSAEKAAIKKAVPTVVMIVLTVLGGLVTGFFI